MSYYNPPSFTSPIFDTLAFTVATDILTQEQADLLYLKFPFAQGTENLQTTNVAGALTCNSLATFNGTTTFPQTVSFTNISIPPTCVANPSGTTDLCNKFYVDSQSALTAYQLYFNYSVPYTVPGGSTYSELSPTQIPTPSTVAWATSSTSPVLLSGFFNLLTGLNIPTSIPAGVWTLLLFANLTNTVGQAKEAFFYTIIGTTALGAETILYTSPASLLLNTVAPLIGSVSIQGTIPLISLTGYTGLGIKLFIQSNTASPTTGSIYYQTSNAYSSVLTSFAVTQAPNILSLNNTWTGTNNFTNTVSDTSAIQFTNSTGTIANITDATIYTSVVKANPYNSVALTGGQTAIGSLAGNTSQATRTVAIGVSAGNNGQLANAVAIGFNAGQNTQKAEAIAIGANSGVTNQGANAVGIGASAGQTNQGDRGLGVGYAAGQNSQGQNSVAVGYFAGQANQRINCIAIGNNAGNSAQGLASSAAIAIGLNAGQTNQDGNTVAIGINAGNLTQGDSSVAIGVSAGETSQGINSVAIGRSAGNSVQGAGAVAIGLNAGQVSQGANSIAIGNNAGTAQIAGTIALNASGVALNTSNVSTYINPIRDAGSINPISNFQPLYYNLTTKELISASLGTSTKLNGSAVATIVSGTIYSLGTTASIPIGTYIVNFYCQANITAVAGSFVNNWAVGLNTAGGSYSGGTGAFQILGSTLTPNIAGIISGQITTVFQNTVAQTYAFNTSLVYSGFVPTISGGGTCFVQYTRIA